MKYLVNKNHTVVVEAHLKNQERLLSTILRQRFPLLD